MSEELKFVCQECGREFDPDPDSMVEIHIRGECPCCESGLTEDDLSKMLEEGTAITAEQLLEMNEEELKEVGLSVQDKEKLLMGEDVVSGGMCICKECQDSLAEGSGFHE